MQSAKRALLGRDYKTARVYFKESLDAGHVWAAWYIGEMHRLGYGGKRNPGKAFRNYRKVAIAADLELTHPGYVHLGGGFAGSRRRRLSSRYQNGQSTQEPQSGVQFCIVLFRDTVIRAPIMGLG